MNKFLTLLKVDLCSLLYGFNLGRGKKSSKSRTFSIVAAIVLYLFFALYIGFFVALFTPALNTAGALWMVPAILFLMYTFFTLMTGIYSIGSVLFSGRDMDQLLSYPVRSYQILLSKLTALLIENWLLGLMVLGAGLGVYSYYAHPEPLFFLYAVIGLFFLPMLPLVIAALTTLLINTLSLGTRFRTLARILLSLIATLAVMLLPNWLISNYTSILLNSGDLLGVLKKALPPIGYLTDALISLSPTVLLWFVLMSLIPFILYIAASSRWTKLLWNKRNNARKTAGPIHVTGSRPLIALLKKEAGRYFSSSIYVLNTGIGMVLMTLVAVSTLFSGEAMINQVLNIPGAGDLLLPGILLVFCFAAGMCSTTAPSLSVEGRQFWIIRSLPVDCRQIFAAKILLNLLVTLPLTLVNSILVTIAFKFIPLDTLLLFAITGSLSLCVALGGLFTNMYFVRLDYPSDMQAVKQSPSVLITMLMLFICIGVLAGIYIAFMNFITFQLFALIALVLLLALALLLWQLLMTKGVKRFSHL